MTFKSATIIDHIYTNDVTSKAKSGIVITDVADHFGTFYMKTKKYTENQAKYKIIRKYNTNNMNIFKNLIRQIDFTDIYNSEDTNQAYNTFIQNIQKAHEQAFPKQTIRLTKKYIKREPWMTSGLLTSTINKNKLHIKKISRPTTLNIERYKKYNSIYNRIKRQIKIKYYDNLFLENRTNMKQTWLELKKLINKQNNKQNLPEAIKLNNELVTHPKQIADSFNDFFVNIGKNLNESIASRRNYGDHITRSVQNSIYINPIDPNNLIKTAKTLKPKLSSGHDNISNRLLLNIIDDIAEHFTHIVNLSFRNGIVPQNMKIAKVVPIHKSGDQTSLNNYRPISLLPVFSKLIEKLMYNQIMSFIDRNDILNKHQYGFRKNHTTTHPILHLLNHIADCTNKPNPELTMAIFIDLKKAFDTISHDILLNKLYKYGIRGVANDWIKNYLTDRKQYVLYDKTESKTQLITYGVPQGSILGPLLFLLYINDLSNALNGNVLSFADDTTIYISDINIVTLYQKANSTVKMLKDWLDVNKLFLNIDKTKYMILGPPKRKYNNDNLHIQIEGKNILQVGNNQTETSIKFLGIHLDENITWKKHMQYINNKITNTLFVMNKVKHLIPRHSLETVYYALIQPYITYGILAWGHRINNDNNQILLKQKRAMRIIYKLPYNSHTDPLFKKSKILKAKDLYIQQALIFMINYEKKNLPDSFTNMFKHNRDLHPDITTRQSNHITTIRPRNNFIASLPKSILPRLWNSWTGLIDLTKSNNTLKRFIKHKQIEQYTEFVYCDNAFCKQCHPINN